MTATTPFGARIWPTTIPIRPPDTPNAGLAQLNERSREIFRQIVESYLATGEPVGSRNISRLIYRSRCRRPRCATSCRTSNSSG